MLPEHKSVKYSPFHRREIKLLHLRQVEVGVCGDGGQQLHPGLGQVVRLVDARHPPVNHSQARGHINLVIYVMDVTLGLDQTRRGRQKNSFTILSPLLSFSEDIFGGVS